MRRGAGWEIRGDTDVQEDEDGLARLDRENAYVDGQDSRQDDDEWRNWRVDDPEHDIFDESDEDEQSLKRLRNEVAQEGILVWSRCYLGHR